MPGSPTPTMVIGTCVVSAALMLQAVVVGGAALERLQLFRSDRREAGDAALMAFFAIALGLFADMAALFALGLAGWLTRTAVLAAAAGLLAISLRASFRFLARLGPGRPSLAGALELIAALALFLGAVAWAMHPPGWWDDTMYHLPLARSYLEHQGIVLNPFLRFPLFPQNMELLFTLGLMFGGDLSAQAFAALPLFVMGVGLIGVSRRLTGSILVGGVAIIVLLVTQSVSVPLGYAYIDAGLALFAWSATLALALAASTEDAADARRWTIVAGVLAGAATGTKYFGGVLAVLLAGALLVLRRDWRLTATFCGTVLACGAWWYVRSFVMSGDPVHPAGGNVFGHFLWNAWDLANQKLDLWTRGVRSPAMPLWRSLQKAGLWLWVPALAGLCVRRAPRLIRLLQLVFVTYLPFWFFVAQLDRYLAPVTAAAAWLSAYAIYQAAGRVGVRLGRRVAWCLEARLLGAVALVIILMAGAPSRYVAARDGLAQWDRTLESLPGYALLREADRRRPELGDRVVQMGFERSVYLFGGTAIGDWFGLGRYDDLMECPPAGCRPLPPDRMKAALARFNSRMLIVSTKLCPALDVDAYAGQMELLLRTPDGALFAVK